MRLVTAVVLSGLKKSPQCFEERAYSTSSPPGGTIRKFVPLSIGFEDRKARSFSGSRILGPVTNLEASGTTVMFSSDYGDNGTKCQYAEIKKEISYNYGTKKLSNSSVCPAMHYQVKENYKPFDEFLNAPF